MKAKRVRQPTETRLAELVFLARAIEAFGIPVREAERFVLPADLAWFVKSLEKRVRAIGKTVVELESTTDFSVEAEELRKLRSGETKIKRPSDYKRPQP
jgi:hypothetical protein